MSGGYTTVSGDMDAILVKLTGDGLIEWASFFGGAADDIGLGVDLTDDGGYILGGSSLSNSPFQEMLLGKCDHTGTPEWTNTIGQIADWEGGEVRQLANGGYVMSGWTEAFGGGNADMYLLFADAQGEFVDGRTYGGLNREEGRSFIELPTGGFLVVGSSASYGPGVEAVFVVKGDAAGFTATDLVTETLDPLPIPDLRPSTPGLLLHPNPARPGDAIIVTLAGGNAQRRSVVLLDQQGRQVAGWPGSHPSEPLRVPSVAPGIYMLHALSADGSHSAAPLLITP